MRSRRHHRGRGPAHRKQLQVSAEVRRCLELSLAGDFDDEVLQDLMVEEVRPLADDRLQVRIAVHGKGLELGREAVATRLEAAKGRLLQELARTLSHRRKVPELVFELVPGGAAGEPGDA